MLFPNVLCYELNVKSRFDQQKTFQEHWRNNCVKNNLMLSSEKDRNISESGDHVSTDKVRVEKCLKWEEDNINDYFSKVLFPDESCAILDVSDGWSKGWVVNGQDHHQRFRREQGGGSWFGLVILEVSWLVRRKILTVLKWLQMVILADKITEYLQQLGSCRRWKMNWSMNSPDLTQLKTRGVFWSDKFTRMDANLEARRQRDK